MRSLVFTAAGALLLPAAAGATTLQAGPGAGVRGGTAAVDPDAHLEALAAASTRERGDVHGRPSTKADRSIIKNDPQLRAAFAWLSNK